MSVDAKTVNELLENAAPLGHEALIAVGLVNGKPVQFKVVGFNHDERGLVLELERSSWEIPGT